MLIMHNNIHPADMLQDHDEEYDDDYRHSATQEQANGHQGDLEEGEEGDEDYEEQEQEHNYDNQEEEIEHTHTPLLLISHATPSSSSHSHLSQSDNSISNLTESTPRRVSPRKSDRSSSNLMITLKYKDEIQEEDEEDDDDDDQEEMLDDSNDLSTILDHDVPFQATGTATDSTNNSASTTTNTNSNTTRTAASYKKPKNKSNGAVPKPRKSTAGAPRIHHCTHCPKSFARRSDLQRHVRTHLNDKPFECTDCQKRFIQVSALRVHQRIHTGEKPYHCPSCDKCFADSSSLVRHRRVHSGERPYNCAFEGCGRSFCRNVTLLKHQLREHGVEVCKQDGKPYLSLLPAADRPRRVRKKTVKNTATSGGGGGGTSTSSSSAANLLPPQNFNNMNSSIGGSSTNGDMAVPQSFHGGNVNDDLQVQSMHDPFDISNSASRRESTTSSISLSNFNHSSMQPAAEAESMYHHHNTRMTGGVGGAGGATGHSYGLGLGQGLGMSYGLTTVHAAKQRLGSLHLQHNMPHLSIPPNPLLSMPSTTTITANGGRRSSDNGMLLGTAGLLTPDGPGTPGTPTSVRSCFSAPEIKHSMSVRPQDVGASPFSDIGGGGAYAATAEQSQSHTQQRAPQLGQLRIHDLTNGGSEAGENGRSDTPMTAGDMYPPQYNVHHQQQHHHRYTNMPEQMFVQTQGHGMESHHGRSGPYSAGYTHLHQHSDQNHHSMHGSATTAPPTQTMFLDHPPHSMHHHSHHQQQQAGSAAHQHAHPQQQQSNQSQYDHLPTPVSASSFFSNSSSGDKQSTAPSSASAATSPYAHPSSQHQPQQQQQGSGAYAHYHSSSQQHPSNGTSYAYSNPYAQYVPPPLSATVASAATSPATAAGYYGEHPHSHYQQLHYQHHPASDGDWATLAHSSHSIDQKERQLEIPFHNHSNADQHSHSHSHHQCNHTTQHDHHHHHHHQIAQSQAQQYYAAHPLSRSNSFNVRDVLGENRKPSLPSSGAPPPGRGHSPFDTIFKMENATGEANSPLVVSVGDESGM